MKAKFFLLSLTVMLLIAGCDIVKPKRKFRLAIPEKDYFYNYMAGHLKPFLESKGFEIIVTKTTSSIEADRMVARGEADLAFINNHSVAVAEVLGSESGRLRTVLPVTTRSFFAFSKNVMPDTATAKELFENKKVGIEVLKGEAQLNFERFLSRAEIKGTQVVTFEDSPEVIVFWGTFLWSKGRQISARGLAPIFVQAQLD